MDAERIQAGDELLIVTPEEQRVNTEERLRAVGQRGRLARWRARAEHWKTAASQRFVSGCLVSPRTAASMSSATVSTRLHVEPCLGDQTVADHHDHDAPHGKQ